MFGNIKYAEDKGKLYLKNVKMIRASLPKGGAFAMSVAQPVNEKSPENGKNSSRYTNDSFHHVNIALRDIQAYFISQEKRIIVKKIMKQWKTVRETSLKALWLANQQHTFQEELVELP